MDKLILELGLWNARLFFEIFSPIDSKVIESIPLSIVSCEDEVLWHYAKNGDYLVHIGYHLLFQDKISKVGSLLGIVPVKHLYVHLLY